MERRVEDFIFRGTDEEAIVYIIDERFDISHASRLVRVCA
ncbi:hypothetical protein B4166_3090 [Caldibacillus thermoamylovorans]|uniref:Uncharacterized protein n=1 Tax=Caldibacillus thermoamylovorans TaxID=35841 RepID=A0ABD4A3V1_9BACI|nr:hypothetical protein B4166_3090 [Caldibacillus thermoamylovorans]KIO71591.1 hypothetical protein B4167_3540 [Caldibacillus thermoamylovorans]